MSKADALGTRIGKLLSSDINLGPNPVSNADGTVKRTGPDNHGMGTVFEEPVRRSTEENNEEAGEPRRARLRAGAAAGRWRHRCAPAPRGAAA